MRLTLRPSCRLLSSITTIESNSQAGAFYPRPSVPSSETSGTQKRGFNSWRALGWFGLANVVPFGAVYWYIKSSIKEREAQLAEMTTTLSGSPQQIASEVALACASADVCLLNFENDVQSMSPHAPESQAIELLPELPFEQYKYDPLLDVLTAQHVGLNLPMNLVYLGVASDRVASLPTILKFTYVNKQRAELVTLDCEWSVEENDRVRDFYWRRRWGKRSEGRLIKMTPIRCSLKSMREDGIPGRVIQRVGEEWR